MVYNNVNAAVNSLKFYYTVYFKSGETPNDYYCGITNDPGRRRVEHNVDRYVHCIEMESFELAAEVEACMNRLGFDTGDQVGNGNDESVFVYLYRKIPGFTQP